MTVTKSIAFARPRRDPKRLFLVITVLGVLAALSGCSQSISKPAAQAVTSVTASNTSVRAGATVTFSATVNGVGATGGKWAVLGGTSNGTIDQNGNFLAPSTVPTPNTVNVAYTQGDLTTTASIEVLNPLPQVLSASPSVLNPPATPIVVCGSHFVPGSMIIVGGSPIATSFQDSDHLSATLAVTAGNSTVQVAVSNPDPGGTTSAPINLTEASLDFTVQPAVLNVGTVKVTVTGTSLPPNSVVVLNGKVMSTTGTSANTITATGYLAPWSTGTASVAIATTSSSTPLGVQNIPIAATAVPFDTAARFTTQAAFGPRPDIVQHIQQIGLDAFITEQQALPGVTYDPANAARTQFLRAAQNGNSLLRLRVALALNSFIVTQGIFVNASLIPFEEMLERDSTGNFRDLLTDVAGDESMGQFLNLTGNNDYPWGYAPPNQNFARELMQLFTLGPNLLNDDGSMQLDASGNPIPTYTQQNVMDLSRALTGWNLPQGVNPAYWAFGIDYSVPLKPLDGLHDHGPKLIVGNEFLPAGQDIVTDRTMALDAIFQHPNLPPFVSRLLIQRLVKSAPSPAYVQRIASVFKNDGTGTRGNLSAVVRAILMDPEARAGDLNPTVDDGFLQEPLLQQMFTTSITQQPIWDDEPDYYCDSLGEPWWYSPTVFGYYSPSAMIPGTQTNSPEFQLFSNVTVTVRSEMLWGMLTGTIPGYATLGYANSSWLYTNFTTIPDLLDALDHLAFHGQMPPALKAEIIAYCQRQVPNDWNSQFESALFLTLNSDSFVVAH